ncbi:hypothetical protein KHA90_04125 [Flavobacterium psychroterrae]|uniref:Histone H1 n=1 Tax=Flavobacterium psychroterrae TaxID=2133767 RepID=A0ABS5P7B4_9FLAO|nr:hypothetical protein [Flavobacterium psychroterrae]MBS7230203.1 hypothetical protein [Flavobacterium psychroterrae]
MAVKKKTVKGLKKLCSSVVKATGLKTDGTLKKGFKYVKGGKIVKITAKKAIVKKKVAKKKPVKKAAKKK